MHIIFPTVHNLFRYRLWNNRERLHYPTWPYDAANATVDVEIFIKEFIDKTQLLFIIDTNLTKGLFLV